MREDLLHFIWKYKKFPLMSLVSSKKEDLVVIDVGTHNFLAGPDFFNAKISIDGQLWAGNIEIHINAADWYVHHHEKDINYENVILHVVWNDDTSVFRKDGSEIPTLELKDYITQDLLDSYENLFDKKQKTFINCEKDIRQTDSFVFQNWLERLYFERLERKSDFVFDLLKKSKTDWESVLFVLLLKNFGLKINGESFLSLGNSLDFSIVRKLSHDERQLESVFYGMSHLLNDDTIFDIYYLQLKREYDYLKRKFELKEIGVLKPEFFKLRPPNFPTIRLSQLANLYNKQHNLFDTIIKASNINELYSIFEVSASSYWNDHYTFGKPSKKTSKKLTKNFIDLLIINTILPLKFCYAKYMGKDVNEEIIKIISKFKAEENSIISGFKECDIEVRNAKDSQAILQLYNSYCAKNRCLECVVGSSLLQRNV